MPVESCDILDTLVAVSAEPHDVPVHAGMQTSWCTNNLECRSHVIPLNAGMQVMMCQ